MKITKIRRSRRIPFGDYAAINLFGVIVAKKGVRMKGTDINHELIHSRQQVEMLWIFFYLWYGVEWLIKLMIYRRSHLAYHNISFEREAYQNQHDLRYLRNRRPFAFIHYLRQ